MDEVIAQPELAKEITKSSLVLFPSLGKFNLGFIFCSTPTLDDLN
jgi:hypothetical protein